MGIFTGKIFYLDDGPRLIDIVVTITDLLLVITMYDELLY